MRHIENIEVTVKSMGQTPQKFSFPFSYKNEVQELLRRLQHREEDSIPAEEAFPDLFDPVKGPAIALQGARLREKLTQQKLAEKIGIRQHHLSEMENGKRPIGKEMAKKLAKILKVNYRVFL